MGRSASSAHPDRVVVWILLALGLLLMLVGVGKGEQASASRVDRFQGPMRSGQSIHVENVSGDIVASAGREFSAVVTVTVSAPTQRKADEILASTKVVGSHDEDGWSLETHWPGARSSIHREGRSGSPCAHCRITARYEIVVPPGVTAELKTVNGDVRVRDCDGELELESVNGTIEVRGVRKSLEAHTINGKIEAVANALLAGSRVELQTVNGSITLTLPKDAKFDFSGETMNGTIASTFPLPRKAAEPADEESPRLGKGVKGDRRGKIIVQSEGDETTVVDLEDLERELEDSMRDVDLSIEEATREARQSAREARRELRRIQIMDPRREYSGSIGTGGAEVRIETLNGAVSLLAAGTSEADAKPLIAERRSFVVTVPPIRVHVPNPQVPPAPPSPPGVPSPPLPPELNEEGEIVRGDVHGDFLSTSTDNGYRIGSVSGRVRILTHSGEIRVGGIGAGADLKTFGGDIVVGAVNGELKAITFAGDIRSEAVTGSVLAETAGGDIRIPRVGGSLEAKTSGGDIIVPAVGGSVRAFTAGGDVRIGVLSPLGKGGIVIHNSGGDVSLTLPADCKADLELFVTGADEQEPAIRSDFGDLAIARKHGFERATLALNGGGEKVVVRTSSGTIRLRKAAVTAP